MRRFVWLFLLLLPFCLISCGGGGNDGNNNNPTPSSSNSSETITGKWVGSITTSNGTSALEFEIDQNGTVVTGIMEIDGGDAPITNGEFKNNIFTGDLQHDFGTVEYKISWGLVVGGTAMSGPMNGTMTYTGMPAPVTTSWNGTAFLAKQ